VNGTVIGRDGMAPAEGGEFRTPKQRVCACVHVCMCVSVCVCDFCAHCAKL